MTYTIYSFISKLMCFSEGHEPSFLAKSSPRAGGCGVGPRDAGGRLATPVTPPRLGEGGAWLRVGRWRPLTKALDEFGIPAGIL